MVKARQCQVVNALIAMGVRGGLEIIQSDLEPHETPSLFPKNLSNMSAAPG